MSESRYDQYILLEYVYKNTSIALFQNHDFNARENGSMKIFFDKNTLLNAIRT